MILNNLTLFDHLKEDAILQWLVHLIRYENKEEAYYSLIRLLLEKQQTLYEYVIRKMLLADNKKLSVFAQDRELTPFEMGCLKHDLTLLTEVFQVDLHDLSKKAVDKNELLVKLDFNKSTIPFVEDMVTLLQGDKTMDEKVTRFCYILKNYGIGPFMLYPAFTVQESDGDIHFTGIKEIITLDWDEIYHYPLQKEALLKNTKSFIENKPFQNVLLVGASGTGKSTSVKSIVNLFSKDKLRLIQMQKGQLHLLPQVLQYIEHRGFKFILFIDDLSFEANEDEYKFLKSFIEGSIAGDASQVAFYVTSNRRHLIKEIRSERENDIHLQDFIQEMTSLSDRFGLTLMYEGLAQKEYFDMIEKMYASQTQQGVQLMSLSIEELQNQGRIYALRHGKMSGRVAMQFIKQLGV